MKSIRSRLLIRLSLVMGILFLASGAAIYSVVRAGMIGNVDDQLRLASIGARELLAPDHRAQRPVKPDKPERPDKPDKLAKRFRPRKSLGLTEAAALTSIPINWPAAFSAIKSTSNWS